MGAVYEALQPVDLSADGALDARIPLGPAGLLHGTLHNGLT
jgi:hypothetical protein